MTEEQAKVITELNAICERLCEIDPTHENEHSTYITILMQWYLSNSTKRTKH